MRHLVLRSSSLSQSESDHSYLSRWCFLDLRSFGVRLLSLLFHGCPFYVPQEFSPYFGTLVYFLIFPHRSLVSLSPVFLVHNFSCASRTPPILVPSFRDNRRSPKRSQIICQISRVSPCDEIEICPSSFCYRLTSGCHLHLRENEAHVEACSNLPHLSVYLAAISLAHAMDFCPLLCPDSLMES